MACVKCFFSNITQNKIKESIHKDKFEDILREYKDRYMHELEGLHNPNKCECNNDSEAKISVANDFYKEVRENREYIGGVFDQVIDIYLTYISENRHKAYVKMRKFLEDNEINIEHPEDSDTERLMFRGRPCTKDCNPFNITEYFHIPFHMRNKIGNQRFSVSGHPMIYFATSLPLVLKELNCEWANVAVFLPRQGCIKKKCFDIANYVEDYLNYIFPEINKDKVCIGYNNDFLMFSKTLFKQNISSSILHQIISFPAKNKNDYFIEEYVLPQLLTEVLQDKIEEGNVEYDGFCYQSTKVIGYEKERKKNRNYCFFIPYNSRENYNMKFMNRFIYACLDGPDDKKNLEQLNNLLREFKCIRSEALAKSLGDFELSRSLSSRYRYYLKSIEEHISVMQDARIDGTPYYKTAQGMLESTLIYNLLMQIIMMSKKGDL